MSALPFINQEQTLLNRFLKQGEQEALALLLLRHRGWIRRRVTQSGVGMSPEDFEQDLYLLLYDRLPRATKIENFHGWLSTVISNRLKDLHRRQKCRDQHKVYVQDHADRAYEADVERRIDRVSLVDRAFEVVNKKEAACLRARYLEEGSFKEVAQGLGLTEKQVCGRIERGMKKMRRALA